MVDANNTRAAAALLLANDASRTSLTTVTNRDIDEDGFFILNDEEIDQIMAVCKPVREEVSI